MLSPEQFFGFLLAAVLISAGNAIVRKAFNIGSNAFLEIQWYLFAGVFMLGVGYVMLNNAHVRSDFISSKLSERTNAIIDAVGIVAFTIPLSILLIDYVIMARRDHGMTRYEAILDACHKRARPIVMTTMAMVFGMLPLALASATSSLRFLAGTSGCTAMISGTEPM